MIPMEANRAEPRQWLLLIHQIPPKPDYFRVKVRRRLQRLGAVPLKNSVYVLPDTEQAREDFAWLAGEIVADGGEVTVCQAVLLSGSTDEEMQRMLEPEAGMAMVEKTVAQRVEPGRTWVTRTGVKVDRMSSAWLIRRFIDAQAKFRFAPSRGYRPGPGELRFDMFEGEFTHEGDLCTFEVLLRRFGLDDRGLRRMAEIVHDIDCKDERYGRPETAGIALIVEGIAGAHAEDEVRLERSAALWDDLHARLSQMSS